METSKIYDLIEGELLHKRKEKIEEKESGAWFFVRAQETFAELEKELNGQEKKLLKSYASSD